MANMNSVGIERESVESTFPPRWVAAMSGAQYYWIHHYHPVALLGYIAVVEGYPPPESAVHDMAARAGVPRESFSSMLRHAKLDQVHRDDLDKFRRHVGAAERRVPAGDRRQSVSYRRTAASALRDVVAQFEKARRLTAQV